MFEDSKESVCVKNGRSEIWTGIYRLSVLNWIRFEIRKKWREKAPKSCIKCTSESVAKRTLSRSTCLTHQWLFDTCQCPLQISKKWKVRILDKTTVSLQSYETRKLRRLNNELTKITKQTNIFDFSDFSKTNFFLCFSCYELPSFWIFLL